MIPYPPLATSTYRGLVQFPITTAQGGLGADNSAANGIPVFTSGVNTFQDWIDQSVKQSASPTLNNLSVTTQLKMLGAGTASAPAILAPDNTTGLYFAAGTVFFTSASTAFATFSSAGSAAPGYGIQNATNPLSGGVALSPTGRYAFKQVASGQTIGGAMSSSADGVFCFGTGAQGNTGGTVSCTTVLAGNTTLGTTGLTKYNNVSTAANGVAAIVASGRFTAQTAAKASVMAYTVGAADSSFEVLANVLVTTATTHNFTVTVAYTDESNTSRTATLSFQALAGGSPATAIANAGGAVPYSSVALPIRCKASTTITVATTGTFTTVTYNVEAFLKQVA